jgi:hypothetical protein
MTVSDLYRVSLLLYPADFRRQFSEEMITVFEQSAGERFANRNTPPVAFLIIEFFSIVKGAYIMQLSRILGMRRNSLQAAVATGEPLTIAELSSRRHAAIQDMCASIASHDFRSARRYSDEEARLKYLLDERERGMSVVESRTA